VIACIGLGWLGTKSPEGVYLIWSRVLAAYYFAFFLLVLPLLGLFEKTRPLPKTIGDPVLSSSR
jgi:ubiquinol-cytochrome c reductase cytochrome b/c1 subunit